MNMLYKRYLFSKSLLMTAFLLFCFFSLYILIDYSLHAQQFMKIEQGAFFKVSKYYIYTIVKRLDIALPLSLLVSTTWTLITLNSHLELIAFQVGSLNIKRLLRPFFIISLFMTFTLYASFEFFLPKSLKYIDSFESKYFKYIKNSQLSKTGVYVFPLEDTGKMIFSKYNQQDKSFEDVYLYLSSDHLWKIQSLTLHGKTAAASFAEEFRRNSSGLIEKVGSYPKHLFEDFDVEVSLKKKPHISYEAENISTLAKDILHKSERYLQQKSYIQTHLLLKLLMPWLPVLCVIAICPFCISFKRDFASFKIYGTSLVLFIFFFTLIDICVILSESSSFPPILTMTLPFFLTFSSFSWNYLNKC